MVGRGCHAGHGAAGAGRAAGLSPRSPGCRHDAGQGLGSRGGDERYRGGTPPRWPGACSQAGPRRARRTLAGRRAVQQQRARPHPAAGDEALELLAEGGFTALKVRVGRAAAADDVAAVRRVREAVGDGVTLVADRNQGAGPGRGAGALRRTCHYVRPEAGYRYVRIEAQVVIASADRNGELWARRMQHRQRRRC